jgi:hypothetical protein
MIKALDSKAFRISEIKAVINILLRDSTMEYKKKRL